MEKKQMFFYLLENAVTNQWCIYSKIYFKFQLQNEISGEDGANYQGSLYNVVYYETKRYYHLHFTCNTDPSQTQSLTWHPLVCLLKGFFINEYAAYDYANYFYENGENF